MTTETQKIFDCSKCGRSFDTELGRDVHEKQYHEQPWHDKELMEELYTEQGLTQKEIGDKFDLSDSNVSIWLRKHGIPTRDRSDWEVNRENEFTFDPDWLREQYYEKNLSTVEIADMVGCHREVVRNRMVEFGIERRTPSEYTSISRLRNPANYAVKNDGYCRWRDQFFGENNYVLVHRLLAVSEYGFDSVTDKVVHHKNGVPWDNRPDNIELMNSSEHGRYHYENGDIDFGRDSTDTENDRDQCVIESLRWLMENDH